ncbi:MAG TPA: hypothetical protein VM032_19045 [Vicinamibacterales bacterium]|nr:hypothetical protein [Vicinamibacterales bacterium]
MTSFSPRLLKGGIVVIEPESGAIQRVIALQYNPHTLTHTLQPKSVGGDTGERSEALRLKGPAVETFKLEAEIDAADMLERGDPTVADVGIYPSLAVLEALVSPTSAQLNEVNRLGRSGTLEIAPMIAVLTLFVWSRNRVTPVRITDLSITEDAFDPALNPISAKVSLGLRVLTVDDLGFDNKAGNIFMAYLRNREQLASRYKASALAALGITGLP